MSHERKMKELLESLSEISGGNKKYFSKHTVMVPSRNEVIEIIKRLQHLMFPAYFSYSKDEGRSEREIADTVFASLKRQLRSAYAFFDEDSLVDTESVAYEILEKIPHVKEMLLKDVIALYEGDPAARSPEEIILLSLNIFYPFFILLLFCKASEALCRKVLRKALLPPKARPGS